MSLTQNQIEILLHELLETLDDSNPMHTEKLNQLWRQLNQLQIKHQISIDDIQFHASSDPLDESITIANSGSLIVDISGWRLSAGNPNQTYIFPDGSLLFPNQKICVQTAGDSQYSFNSHRPIWNNQGDLGTLLNQNGEEISLWAYGNRAHNDILISDINFEGRHGKEKADEFIEITNISSQHVIDLSKWRIESMSNEAVFIFPEHTSLAPESSLKVFTNKTNLAANEYTYHSRRAIWNGKQGGACVLDYQDRMVCDYHY